MHCVLVLTVYLLLYPAKTLMDIFPLNILDTCPPCQEISKTNEFCGHCMDVPFMRCVAAAGNYKFRYFRLNEFT